MPVVSTPAGDIFYLGRGRGDTALICVHGAGGTHAHWGYQMRDLSDASLIYTIDLPGHGRSTPPGRTTVAEYGAALLDMIDVLGLERAALVGHSMGGAIALWAALQAPERVAGLGLVGTGGRLRVAPAILDGLSRDLLATIRLIAAARRPSHPRWSQQGSAGDYSPDRRLFLRTDRARTDASARRGILRRMRPDRVPR